MKKEELALASAPACPACRSGISAPGMEMTMCDAAARSCKSAMHTLGDSVVLTDSGSARHLL